MSEYSPDSNDIPQESPLTDAELDDALRRYQDDLLRYITSTLDLGAGLRQIVGEDVDLPENLGPAEQV